MGFGGDNRLQRPQNLGVISNMSPWQGTMSDEAIRSWQLPSCCSEKQVHARLRRSTPVALPLEVEVQVQDAALKGALVPLLVAVLPLLVDHTEGDVLIGRACMKPQEAGGPVLICLGILLQLKGGRVALVDEVGVEDVEFVALHNLGGRVVMVVVRLVVLVPFVARVDPVEVLGLARPVLVMPPVHLRQPQICSMQDVMALLMRYAMLGTKLSEGAIQWLAVGLVPSFIPCATCDNSLTVHLPSSLALLRDCYKASKVTGLPFEYRQCAGSRCQ